MTAITPLNDHLIRVRCNNPGVMTGSGTNTYIVHDDSQAWVIDPGPNEPEHVQNILKACGDRKLSKVFVTHMHPDHSPAHAPLIEKTSAELLGLPPVEDPYQDETCIPEINLVHNQVFHLNDQVSVKAVLTPGHVDNHVCFFIEPSNIMITGDHIMQGSTVVIIPPHGKMKEYIESLQLMLEYPVAALAPGHGELIEDAASEVSRLVEHRLGREAKVLAGLQKLSPVDSTTLVRTVYEDTDPSLHAVAELSQQAHLIKLEVEGKARFDGALWHVI